MINQVCIHSIRGEEEYFTMNEYFVCIKNMYVHSNLSEYKRIQLYIHNEF